MIQRDSFVCFPCPATFCFLAVDQLNIGTHRASVPERRYGLPIQRSIAPTVFPITSDEARRKRQEETMAQDQMNIHRHSAMNIVPAAQKRSLLTTIATVQENDSTGV